MPQKFSGVVLSNGGLPAGQDPPKAFAAWRTFAKVSPVFPIGGLIQKATKTELSNAEVAAYDAPYPTRASKAAARVFPALVPLGPNEAVLLQRRRPDHQRRRRNFQGPHPRRKAYAPPYLERGPLHPGGRPRGLCRRNIGYGEIGGGLTDLAKNICFWNLPRNTQMSGIGWWVQPVVS
jgi:hypothetical protein